jgi:hypothetical protein
MRTAWGWSVLRQPLRRCTSTTLCNYTKSTGRRPVIAQRGPRANAKGSGIPVAVYPMPPRIIKALTYDLAYGVTSDPLSAHTLTYISEEFRTWDEPGAACDILYFGVQPTPHNRRQVPQSARFRTIGVMTRSATYPLQRCVPYTEHKGHPR